MSSKIRNKISKRAKGNGGGSDGGIEKAAANFRVVLYDRRVNKSEIFYCVVRVVDLFLCV